ncbi:AMP-binding protein [Fulvivirgaceae bacterium BMA10]|uniref:Long-chain-fatty-acid--CoA ligase n=1 Tax=Splendidivirga corallicola TaxID=3051826 RepID=A0ABT8KL18_9BACT|nr:AMP-binding protein [Fulvivirgaceae bacterium BMA10]
MDNYSWFNHYPTGVPREINPDNYASILELFEECSTKYGDMVAYENMGTALTFNQLDTLSEHFAAYLQKVVGLQKGDRVAIQMPNLLQYPIAMFGALRAGMTVVNTNPLYTSREMEHQFKDSGAKVLIILANFANNLEKILDKTDISTVIITEIGDMLKGLKGPLVNFVVKKVKKMVPPYHLPDALRFKSVLKAGKKATYDRPSLHGEDIAFLQYTGGTTGVAKGAMLTHRNIIANMEQISGWMIPKLREKEETVITALPLYHIFALTVNCLAMLKIGAKNILITNPRDMKAFIKDLKKYPFTVLTGVNTLFNGLLNQEEFKNVNFASLKIAVGGGMAVQDAVALEWKKVTGTALAEGYGLTETSPVLSCNPIDDSERLGTIGLPLPSTEIKLIDDDDQVVEVGEVGEICARGPQIMKGYWERPDETQKVFLVDWIRTGDMGVIDEDGFIKIVDRKKEMICVSGFNVYPNEVENVVSSHPKVLEVGAIGVPDERSTEVVKVYVVKKDESLEEEELIEFCKENMTGYKVPKYVEFRKELPKSNVGKILRRVLKEEEEAQ